MGFINNMFDKIYGNDEDEEDVPEEDEEKDDSDEIDNSNPYGEDEMPEGEPPEEGEGEVAQEEEKEEAPKKPKLSLGGMKKEAIMNGCSPRVEPIPCPICHKKSIYKSYKLWDWVPLQAVAYYFGVTLNRFYCFNKSCPKSFYKGYVFNCTSPKFTPATLPTKRPLRKV